MFESNLDSKIDIKVLPLIDVIFFLLVFFMLFTTFRTSPMGLNINLPQAETVTEQEEEVRIMVNISEEGEVSIDEEMVQFGEMGEKIDNIIADTSPGTLFIINADKRVEYEQIMRAMDIIRSAGGYRLALAAERENAN